MAGRYKSYPEYKDSRIEWLGDVPEHWESVPIKYMALEGESLFIDGDWIESKDISNEGIRYITTGNVTSGKYREQGSGYITEDTFLKLNCIEVLEGDLLIARLNDPIGRACIVPNLESKIVTSIDNVIFRPDKKYYKNYLVHLFSSEGYFRHTGNLARGATMQRISRGLLGNIRIVVPLFEEQEKIANFLDHEAAKIDTLIEKQQQLIQLLKEKRQAVISHAVTKGLNPNAKMRDSGVEWLGEVPEGWGIKKLKYLCDLQTGDKNTEDAVDEGEYPFFVRSQTVERLSSFTADCEAVLTAGDGVGVGKVFHYINGKFDFHQRVYMMNNFNHVSGQFFFHYLSNMFHKVALDGGAKSTVDSLRMPVFMNFNITVPLIEEQASIVKFIESNNLLFDDLTLKASKAIELMQERRSALISAAVTGQIDVRDWFAPQTSQTNKAVAA